MKLVSWIPLPVFLLTSVAAYMILETHHATGNRFNNAPNYLRSNTLVYDPARISVAQLPIRKDLHPQLRVKESGDTFYKELETQGWALGHKSDGSPMEPAATELQRIYDEVDRANADLARVAPLCYLGYFGLGLINLLATGLAIRGYRGRQKLTLAT